MLEVASLKMIQSLGLDFCPAAGLAHWTPVGVSVRSEPREINHETEHILCKP